MKQSGVTLKHFARTLFLPMKKLATRSQLGAPAEERMRSDIETVQYPEEKVAYAERFRGLHRLMKREDDTVRCVACMCCPTVCPAHCITIVPEESDHKGIEKRPAVFEIDELRCVVCGLCVEACPCDAIRMDTYVHPRIWGYNRADFVETKETLIGRSRTLAEGGPTALMERMIGDYRQQEEADAVFAAPVNEHLFYEVVKASSPPTGRGPMR